MKQIFFILLALKLLILSISDAWAFPNCEGSNSSTWNNCIGNYEWDDGDKYVGEYRNGYRTGQGTYYHGSGSIYIGGFKDNKRFHEKVK